MVFHGDEHGSASNNGEVALNKSPSFAHDTTQFRICNQDAADVTDLQVLCKVQKNLY